MDVPILTAIIGVSGTLMGASVGGCLTPFTNFLLQKRREQAELRIGCRLIEGELQESEHVISIMLEFKRWWPSEVEPKIKAWEEHRHVLASYLSYETWDDVQRAIFAVHNTNQRSAHAHAAKQETMHDGDTLWVAGCVEYIQKGRTGLLPYLEPRFSRRLVAAYLRRSPTGRVSRDHPWLEDQVATRTPPNKGRWRRRR
jgi:hypothetical protein